MNEFEQSVAVPGFDPDPVAPPAGFLIEARKITVNEALRIIPDTLGILVRGLGMYLAISLAVVVMYAITSIVLGFLFGSIPVLDVLVLEIGIPVAFLLLFYGWYRIIDTREAEGSASFTDLFVGFIEDPLRVAGAVLAIWVGTALATVLATVVVGVIVEPSVLSSGGKSSIGFPRMSFALGFFMLVAMIALTPLMSVQGLFLTVVAIGRQRVWFALGSAVRAALRNWVPIMAVSAIVMVAAALVAMIFGIIVGGIAGLLGFWIAMLIALPAIVLGMALMPVYGYALFKRLYYAQPADEIEESRPSRLTTTAPPPEAFAPPPVDHDAPWTLAVLRALDPHRFGALCSAYFSSAGFHIEPRHGLTDGSARFALAAPSAPDKPMMFVETVGWGAAADLPRVRTFREAQVRNQLPRGTIVAASGFTEDALKDAAANKVRAIDGAELLTLILKLPPEKQQALRDAAFPKPAGPLL